MRFMQGDPQSTLKSARQAFTDGCVNVAGKEFRGRQLPGKCVQRIQILVVEWCEGIFEDLMGESNVDDDIFRCQFFGPEFRIDDIRRTVHALCRTEFRVWQGMCDKDMVPDSH